MSGQRRGVPAECRDAYRWYEMSLAVSALGEHARTAYARTFRRFLRWLPGSGLDVAAVLAGPQEWAAAVAAFIAGLRPGVPFRAHLADAGRRLGLEPSRPGEKRVPPRWRRLYDDYGAALERTAYAGATAGARLRTLGRFLRWADAAGYGGDLRGRWDAAVDGYLAAVADRGGAPATVRDYRSVLRHVAATSGLPGG